MNKKWLYLIYVSIFISMIGIELFIILYFKKSWWILGGTLIGIAVVAGIIFFIWWMRKKFEVKDIGEKKLQIITEQLKPIAEKIVIAQRDDMIITDDIRTLTVGESGAEKTTIGAVSGKSYNFPSKRYYLAINMNDATKFSIVDSEEEFRRAMDNKFNSIIQGLAENPEKEEYEEYIPIETATGERRTMIRKVRKTRAEIEKQKEEAEHEEKEAL